MSERKTNLESVLRRLEFSRPAEDYFAKGENIIRQNNHNRHNWNLGLSAALCAALLLSIGLNLLQASNGEKVITEPLQLTTSRELQAADISEPGSVFRFLCLTTTTVALKNSPNIGQLKGFGEWAFFQTPDNYAVTVSLLPLREWNAIGQFEDGVISLQLEEGEVMELRGVGVGPSSLKRGGPFPVYGNIQKLDANSVSPNLANQSQPTADPLTAIDSGSSSGTRDRGIPLMTNVIAGVDTELSPLTQKYFGALLRSGECG